MDWRRRHGGGGRETNVGLLHDRSGLGYYCVTWCIDGVIVVCTESAVVQAGCVAGWS